MAVALRVGDSEREATVERLSKHAADGRLTVAELEERVERAQRAVYARDLSVLEADLPAAAPAPRRPVPVAPLVALLAAIALTAAVGHPIVPLFILSALLWRARRPARWSRPPAALP